MDLTLTVTCAATRADLRLTASAGSAAGPVLTALRAAVNAAPDATITVDGAEVPADGMVADCGFAPGVLVRVGGIPFGRPRPTPEIVVTSGPDAARRRALDRPRLVVGRGDNCDLVVGDASVSRQHLLVAQTEGTTTVTDLESANGTLVDGEPLRPGVPTVITTGSTLQIGHCELRLEDGAAVHGPAAAAGLVVRRPPRLGASPPVAEVRFPPPVIPRPPTRLPLIAALAPLLGGVALSVGLHQWQFLAFTALSPLMVLGQAAGDRVSSGRAHRRARRSFDSASSAAQAMLARELAAERRRRYDAAPDLGRVTGAAIRGDALLWQRRVTDPDALQLRLGRGDLPSEIRVVNRPGAATALDVPICVALAELGGLGVCGPADLVSGLLRSLVIQAATLHSPRQLRIVILAPGRSDEWHWARWLPHVAARGEDSRSLLGFDDDQVARRLAELAGRRDERGAHTLVVVDGRGVPGSSALMALLDDAGRGLSTIWSASEGRELPDGCHAVVSVVGGPRPVLQLSRVDSSHVLRATVEPLSADLTEAAARRLAPLLDGSTSGSGLPWAVRWADLNPIDLHDRASGVRSLLDSWSRGPSTEIALGRDADGAVVVDLRRDGPHTLIAGTTGAGKSELLVSIVAGLAARNRPDQLSLLLIDHKGGAALGGCARLPHAVGLVTDLDGASTQRALRSLTAELRRREAVLAAAGVADLEAYTDAGSGGSFARLVIVIDEFATLVEEQPDFVGRLIGIAQRGRSLGVHLILATQRPDGVVSADIRANTRLRICLGVAREQESRDVIDSPVAAAISRRTPGRGYLRIGPGELHEFQTARVGGARPTADEVSVSLEPAAVLGDPPPRRVESPGPTDLDVLLEAAAEASAEAGCRPPPPTWLPPLPDRLALSDLPRSARPGTAAWGLVDLPADGRQAPLLVDAGAPGALLIAGSARSGRSTAAMTFVMSVASRVSPERLNLWAVDSGNGLAELARLPHCGGVIPAHETERVDSLLDFLSREIAERRRGHQGGPALALVVDGWDGLLGAHDDRRRGEILDRVSRLVADGPSGMLHTVVTGDRGILTGRLAGLASEKFALRLADRSDFAVIGMPLRELPRDLPPGRGVRASDLAVVQFAESTAATVTVARQWPPPTSPPVRRFDPLPTRVGLESLPPPSASTRGHVALGVAAEDNAIVSLPASDISRFLVTGSAGSGRSSALVTIASQLSGRRLVVSCPAGSPLAALPRAVSLPRDDQAHAVAILDALCSDEAVMPHLVVDDLDLLPDGALSTRIEGLLRTAGHDGGVVAVSAASDLVAGSFRGPLGQVRRIRVGLLLGPASRHDGELFGIRLGTPAGHNPPGRGWLARNGTATRLQVAVAGSPYDGLPAPDVLSGGRHLRGRNVDGTSLGTDLAGTDLGGARLLG